MLAFGSKSSFTKIFPAKRSTAIQCNTYQQSLKFVGDFFFLSQPCFFFRFWHHFCQQKCGDHPLRGATYRHLLNDNLLMGEKKSQSSWKRSKSCGLSSLHSWQIWPTCFTHVMLANYGWSNLLNPQKCSKGYRNMKQRLSHFSPDFKESLAMFSSHCTEKFGLWLNDCDWGGKIIGRFIGGWQAF